MSATEASLIIDGPMGQAEANRIIYSFRTAIWVDLHSLLVDEDEELRYGVTMPEDASVVLDVAIHFRVSDLGAAVARVRERYEATGMNQPARVRECPKGGGVGQDYPVAPAGEQRHAERITAPYGDELRCFPVHHRAVAAGEFKRNAARPNSPDEISHKWTTTFQSTIALTYSDWFVQ